MLKVATSAALLAVALAGCVAKVSTGGGDVGRLHSDLKSCARETFAFGLIPDGGSTADYHRTKCMKERGWARDFVSGVNDWAWAGPDSFRQLARYPDGRERISVICGRGLTCQPVVETTAPAEWTAWAYEVRPDSQFWRSDEVIVGDLADCDSVRQRDAMRGVPTAESCRGPLYFRRR